MRLSQILFVGLFYASQANCQNKCTRTCARKQATKEHTARCAYIIHNFKPRTRTTCPRQEANYQDIYKTNNETSHEQLYSQYQSCMDWLAGTVFENLIYMVMIIYFVCIVRYPWA